LEGDLRVQHDTILVTYYNAPRIFILDRLIALLEHLLIKPMRTVITIPRLQSRITPIEKKSLQLNPLMTRQEAELEHWVHRLFGCVTHWLLFIGLFLGIAAGVFIGLLICANMDLGDFEFTDPGWDFFKCALVAAITAGTAGRRTTA
jgi:hypothetical protein